MSLPAVWVCSPRISGWGRRSAEAPSSSNWSAAHSCCPGWNLLERLRELQGQTEHWKAFSDTVANHSEFPTRTVLVRQHQQLLALFASIRVTQDEFQADVGERRKVTYGVLWHGAVVHHLLLQRLPARYTGGVHPTCLPGGSFYPPVSPSLLYLSTTPFLHLLAPPVGNC